MSMSFLNAERALSELYPVLVAGRRMTDDLNRAFPMLAGPGQGSDFAGSPFDFAQQLLSNEDARRAARTRTGFDSVADLDSAYRQVLARVEEETGFCSEVLSRLAAAGAAPGGSVGRTGARSRYDASFGLLGEANEVASILDGTIGFPADPKGVHQAWLLLRPEQRAELLKGDPARFGNLNGIPAADRNTANMITLDAQRLLLQRACEELGIASPKSPEDFDRIPPGILSVLEVRGLSVQGARQTLLLKAQLAPGGVPTQLLAYEPGAYGGKGRAAIAYGDVDRADSVAFCVPGLNSGLHNFGDVAGDALDLFKQAALADRDQHTAVVAWQGYDAPGLSEVLSQDNAERGARLLATDVNTMRITHTGPIGALTVVGHSYGSTTTGLALQREQLDVDQVALIGSPGVGGDARTAADLGLDASRVFVGSASRDTVTLAHGLSSNILGTDTLGADPSRDAFGGTRFKAESVDRGLTATLSDHSRYYDADNHSESLYSLAEIITGHGDQLGAEGMLAGPRHEVGLDTSDLPLAVKLALRGLPLDVAVDPEGFRTPTAGHDHANDVGTPSP